MTEFLEYQLALHSMPYPAGHRLKVEELGSEVGRPVTVICGDDNLGKGNGGNGEVRQNVLDDNWGWNSGCELGSNDDHRGEEEVVIFCAVS